MLFTEKNFSVENGVHSRLAFHFYIFYHYISILAYNMVSRIIETAKSRENDENT